MSVRPRRTSSSQRHQGGPQWSAPGGANGSRHQGIPRGRLRERTDVERAAAAVLAGVADTGGQLLAGTAARG